MLLLSVLLRKLVELKNMYQHEIDNLMHEKDAAVVEAGRVAARYAETGKKQVSTMQKQVDKLKAVAAMTIREKIKQEGIYKCSPGPGNPLHPY